MKFIETAKHARQVAQYASPGVRALVLHPHQVAMARSPWFVRSGKHEKRNIWNLARVFANETGEPVELVIREIIRARLRIDGYENVHTNDKHS